MNQLTFWCCRVGSVCGGIAIVSALAILLNEMGVAVPTALQAVAQWSFLIFGLAFMGIGIVLLVAAIAWLARSWSHLSRPVKVVSVLGLGTSTFLGAYIFFWLVPDLGRNRG